MSNHTYLLNLSELVNGEDGGGQDPLLPEEINFDMS